MPTSLPRSFTPKPSGTAQRRPELTSWTADRVAGLVAAAIARYDRSDDSEDRFFDESWQRLVKAPDDTVAAAKPFLMSTVPRERSAAAEIIGRVGEANGGSVAEESYDLLFQTLLHEPHDDARDALASGICLIWHSRDDVRAPLKLASHSNPNARYAAAKSLGLTTTSAPEDGQARAALDILVRDPDEGVRKWAEFGLETLDP